MISMVFLQISVLHVDFFFGLWILWIKVFLHWSDSRQNLVNLGEEHQKIIKKEWEMSGTLGRNYISFVTWYAFWLIYKIFFRKFKVRSQMLVLPPNAIPKQVCLIIRQIISRILYWNRYKKIHFLSWVKFFFAKISQITIFLIQNWIEFRIFE